MRAAKLAKKTRRKRFSYTARADCEFEIIFNRLRTTLDMGQTITYVVEVEINLKKFHHKGDIIGRVRYTTPKQTRETPVCKYNITQIYYTYL